MKKIVAALAAALALTTAGAAAARTGGGPIASCVGGTLLVNVHFQLLNDYDSGFAGNAWANDTIDRHVQVWQKGDGSFCASVEDTGTFTTFAGPSPSGLSTVSAGVRGVILGGYVTTAFTGTFDKSAYATRGDLGRFDLACTPTFSCPGAHPSYASWFSSRSGDSLALWGWAYYAGRHGKWLNALGVDAAHGGDITG